MAAYVPIGASSTPPSLFLVGVLHFPTYWSGNLTTLYCTSAGSSGGTGTLEDPFTGTDAYEAAWAALNNGKGKIFCARGSAFVNTDDITHTGGHVTVKPYGSGANPTVDMGTYGHVLDGLYYQVYDMTFTNWDETVTAGYGCFDISNAGGLWFEGCIFDGESTALGSAIRFLGTQLGDNITGDYYTPVSNIINCQMYDYDGDGIQQFGNAPFNVYGCTIHSLTDDTDTSLGALGSTDAIVAHEAWGTAVEIAGCTIYSCTGKSAIELKDAIGSVHHNLLYFNDPTIGHIVARQDVGVTTRSLSAIASPGHVDIYCNCITIATVTTVNPGFGGGIFVGEGGKARVFNNTVLNNAAKTGPAEPDSGWVPSYTWGSSVDAWGNISQSISAHAHHLDIYGHVLHGQDDYLIRTGVNLFHNEAGGVNRYAIIPTSTTAVGGTPQAATEFATLALLKANASVVTMVANESELEVDTRVSGDPGFQLTTGATLAEFQASGTFHAAHDFLLHSGERNPTADALGYEFPRSIGNFGAMSSKGRTALVTSTNSTQSLGAKRLPLESPYQTS